MCAIHHDSIFKTLKILKIVLNRFTLTDSRFRCFYTCVSGVLGVSLVYIGVSVLSADVVVVVVRPDVITRRVCISSVLQRSSKGLLESSRQGAHDRPITPNLSKNSICGYMTLRA
jgi:hypothetical protein